MPLYSIAPSSSIYADHVGMVYHPEDDPGTSEINQAYYEIQAEGDYLEILMDQVLEKMGNPRMTIFTAHGDIGFALKDRATGDIIIDEYSGFDTNAWTIDVTGLDHQLHITNFNAPDDSVDATQAAILPTIRINDARS